MLDEVDDYCRDGDLVSLVTPPEAVAYRRWFLDEFIRQLRDDADPRPWPGFEAGTEEEPDEPQGPPTAEASGATVIEVQCALDLDGASRLRQLVSARLDEGHATVLFDLRDCDFVDSVGLSLLLTTRNRCIEMGGSLQVTNLQPFVRTTFLHAGLLELLEAEG
jgi:anti-anti-sigma factor